MPYKPAILGGTPVFDSMLSIVQPRADIYWKKKSFQNALEKIFNVQDAGIFSSSLGMEIDHLDDDEESVTDLARRVTQYFQAAQGSIQKGNWIEYGRYQELLEEAILDLSMVLELEEE